MKKEIRAIIKEPKKSAFVKTIPNTLESLQNLVGGYIQCISLGQKNGKPILAICNEEGKLMGLPNNIPIGYDVLCGTVVIVGDAGEDFGDCPLTLDEFKACLPKLQQSGMISIG